MMAMGIEVEGITVRPRYKGDCIYCPDIEFGEACFPEVARAMAAEVNDGNRCDHGGVVACPLRLGKGEEWRRKEDSRSSRGARRGRVCAWLWQEVGSLDG